MYTIKFDDTIQNANNPIADFDQVDDAKQRFDEANAVQNNAAPAVAPRQANLLPPSYPRFKGLQSETHFEGYAAKFFKT